MQRGSFATSFDAEILGNVTSEIPEPVCIPPTTRMLVVTGAYDSVEEVLIDLGFTVRANYSGSSETVVDESGSLDILDGINDTWVEAFLGNPEWMSQYRIIFFNCSGVPRSGR